MSISSLVTSVAEAVLDTDWKAAKLKVLNCVLDGPVRRHLEGERQRLDPWGSWMHSTFLDTAPPGFHETDETRRRLPTSEGANLLYSQREDGLHVPMFDIDMPVRWVPSTTPGKGHLYIDKPMTWPKLAALLAAFAEAGIVHRNYQDHSLSRGYTCLRPAFVRKPSLAEWDSDTDWCGTEEHELSVEWWCGPEWVCI